MPTLRVWIMFQMINHR